MRYITILLLFTMSTPVAYAQGLSIGISPTLIDIGVAPTQSWESSIRVINTNDFDLTLYAFVKSFRPDGESGMSSFSDVDPTASTLSNWLTVSSEPIVVPRQSSTQVPIKVSVPESADPGGHYAAIQFSTQPPPTADNASAIVTTQIVTALLFARVAGDVVELGRIRSFRTDQAIYSTTEARFELRFENTGNVHIQPNGIIKITNMWGTERGSLPINRNTQFGNVLPGSIRLYDLRWDSQFSLSDIGRYTAELRLVYGQDGVQSVIERTSFWVIPLRSLALVLLVLGALFWLIRYAIRAYVKRMLSLAGIDPNIHRGVPVSVGKLKGGDVRLDNKKLLVKPLQVGIDELSGSLQQASGWKDRFYTLARFVLYYKKFFFVTSLIILLTATVLLFVSFARKPAVPYEVTYNQNGQVTTVTSDEMQYDAGRAVVTTEESEAEVVEREQPYTLEIINASGVSGATVPLRALLETDQIVVDTMSTDLQQTQKRTVILYNQEFTDEALALSELLGGVLLSAQTESGTSDIVISVGENFVLP